jgi:hypothetical protein
MHMLKLKNKKILLLPLLIFGWGYFSVLSSLSVDDFWKSQIALIPVQMGAVIYFTYLRWNTHKSPREPNSTLKKLTKS